jgi:hypothetical protein
MVKREKYLQAARRKTVTNHLFLCAFFIHDFYSGFCGVNMTIEFKEFPKMARWSRDIVITEKIDGSNASIYIGPNGEFLTGSRTRWITPEDDNFGFSKWAHENKEELLQLGEGVHFGEWWGAGIQRKYNIGEKRFSLFNTHRWDESRPSCCHVVPVLYQGPNDAGVIESVINALALTGSIAAPGFMNPEGVVLFHVAGQVGFKKTIHKDESPKSMV